MTPADRTPQVGQSFAGYRIEAVLGRGGMGVVYLATHEQLGRKAALKILIPELAEDEDFRLRFIRESQLAASLEHPNVIPIYDAADVGGVLFIAMRYVEGDDLKSVLKREGSLPPGRTLEIVSQIAGALDVAHAAGLVHRDVKPANILIAADTGQAFLSDFGVAKSAGQTGFTRTGSFLGSVDYCPPEQIEGKPLDGRADVYGLGCVLFHCLAGQPPYVRETEVAVINAHLNDPVPALTTTRPDLPRSLDGVIVTAMAKHPEVRYRTAGELANALRSALEGAGASDGAVTMPAPTVPLPVDPSAPSLPGPTVAVPQRQPKSDHRHEPHPKRQWVIAGAIGATLVLVGLGAVTLLARPGSSSPDGPTATSAAFNRRVSQTVSPIVAPQDRVAALAADLSPTEGSFAALRAAASRLERSTFRAEGVARTLPRGDPDEAAARQSLLVALKRQAAYASALANLPPPPSFTKVRARALISQADESKAAYGKLDATVGAPCCPKMPIGADTARRFLVVAREAQNGAVPRLFVGQLENMLTQSASGRSEITSTLAAVLGCRMYTSDAASRLESVISNRQSLLDQLAALQPPTSQTAQVALRLQQALTHSIEADRHYRDWLVYLSQVDPTNCGTLRSQDYNLARSEDAQASAAKSAFVAAFNPLARRFAARQWSESQF